MTVAGIRGAVDSVRDETCEFLCGLIRIPSVPGQEGEAVEYARRHFASLAETRAVPVPEALPADPEFSHWETERATGRSNLVVSVPGLGRGRSLLWNTHLDVVPASENDPAPFCPQVEDGTIAGRGACDAKGQAAAIFAVLLALRRLGVTPAGGLTIHLVVEEETGGNGTLALVREGVQADGCVVLEPTGLRVMAATRGAVWFRIACEGQAAHIGGMAGSRNALQVALRALDALAGYHERLRQASREVEPWAAEREQLPMLIGRLTGGRWPSMVPVRASVDGAMGFLTNTTREQVMRETAQVLADAGAAVEFPYRHNPHVLAPDHELPETLLQAARESGIECRVAAMNASCDAWFYQNFAGIPTVVFGPGDLRLAHSGRERIHLDEIAGASAALIGLLDRWCGLIPEPLR